MQKEIIAAWASANGIEITETQFATLAAYQARVLDVNQHMNLTRITGPQDFAVKHIIDSLTLLPYITPNAKLIDIGTGAGFPGLVLRIMREDLQLTLLDSLRKRVNFLNETTEILGIPAQCIHARAEEYSRKHREFYDICTARAVASMDKLAKYALPVVKNGGVFLAMKGPDIQDELKNAKPAIEKYGGHIEKIDLVKISEGQTHSIVAIKKST
ncbi:MAG: 16S rRNA (guanine(527)-N(7))-methyltransferase RsmG [Defluviitaleaceae bacterium]|nr:16S rRNA (guanine(527)-N(7))-methyltransferase RsmG [Defluviitaleaceae bacterium]MCL2264319.1 16S rRNA (guanine(527)-N(7))-methyltransferase RsmG [Defluviitaleaceae bacterium]